MGTSVTPTQPAMASAASAEVLASTTWPISAAAPEYSARRRAAVSAVIERRNARTAGRSALAQSCEMVDCTLTAGGSQGNGDGFDDIAKNGIGGFRFFLERSVARAGDNAMRENGNGELFEVVGEAIVAAIEVGACLRGALEHERAARADAEGKLLALAREIDDLESVVVQAGIDFDVGNGVLHGQRSEEHTSELQSRLHLVCRLLLEKKKLILDRYSSIINWVIETVRTILR